MLRTHWLAFAAALALLNVLAFAARLRAVAPPCPNVLLITVDSLRPDHLGCYGYANAATPRIDELAREGVRFETAVAQASWTWPSTHSLLTSTDVSTHGAWYWNVDSPPGLATLPSHLKAQGYACGLVSGHTLLAESASLTAGMDVVAAVDHRNDIAPRVVKALNSLRARPFFLWVHLMETHEGATDGLPGANYLQRYDHGVERADRTVGRLMDALKRLELYENTIIVLTSDHGEGLGMEGGDGFTGHGTNLSEAVLRVPLIVAHGAGLPAGESVSAMVAHIDVAPTICELLGMTAPATFEGQSFLSAATGEGPGRTCAFSVHLVNDKSALAPDRGDVDGGSPREAWTWRIASVQTPKWKLLRSDHLDGKVDVQLYRQGAHPDLESNPTEQDGEQVRLLSNHLQEWLARSPAASPGKMLQLTDAQRQLLVNLHYSI